MFSGDGEWVCGRQRKSGGNCLSGAVAPCKCCDGVRSFKSEAATEESELSVLWSKFSEAARVCSRARPDDLWHLLYGRGDIGDDLNLLSRSSQINHYQFE